MTRQGHAKYKKKKSAVKCTHRQYNTREFAMYYNLQEATRLTNNEET